MSVFPQDPLYKDSYEPKYVLISEQDKTKEGIIRAYQRQLLTRSTLGTQLLRSGPHYHPIAVQGLNSNTNILPEIPPLPMSSNFENMPIKEKQLLPSLSSPIYEQTDARVLGKSADSSPTAMSDSTAAPSASSSTGKNLFQALRHNKDLAKIIMKQTAEKLEKQGILKKDVLSATKPATTDYGKMELTKSSGPLDDETHTVGAIESSVCFSNSLPDAIAFDGILREERMQATYDRISSEQFNVQKQLDQLEKFKKELEALSVDQIKERLSIS